MTWHFVLFSNFYFSFGFISGMIKEPIKVRDIIWTINEVIICHSTRPCSTSWFCFVACDMELKCLKYKIKWIKTWKIPMYIGDETLPTLSSKNVVPYKKNKGEKKLHYSFHLIFSSPTLMIQMKLKKISSI